jgi:hypothetical protein
MRHISCTHGRETKSKRMNRAFAQDVMAVKIVKSVSPLLKFWRGNFFSNFSPLCLEIVKNPGRKQGSFMKETAI